jgi:hypothetical protein
VAGIIQEEGERNLNFSSGNLILIRTVVRCRCSLPMRVSLVSERARIAFIEIAQILLSFGFAPHDRLGLKLALNSFLRSRGCDELLFWIFVVSVELIINDKN